MNAMSLYSFDTLKAFKVLKAFKDYKDFKGFRGRLRGEARHPHVYIPFHIFVSFLLALSRDLQGLQGIWKSSSLP